MKAKLFKNGSPTVLVVTELSQIINVAAEFRNADRLYESIWAQRKDKSLQPVELFFEEF